MRADRGCARHRWGRAPAPAGPAPRWGPPSAARVALALIDSREGASLPAALARPLVSKFWRMPFEALPQRRKVTRSASSVELLCTATRRSVLGQGRIKQSQTWRTTKQTDRIGRGKRRRRIRAAQTPRPSLSMRQEDWRGRARALEMYVQLQKSPYHSTNKGRLKKSASTSRSSTASLKKRLRSSLLSLVPQVSARPRSSRV